MTAVLYSQYQSPAGKIILTQEGKQLTGLWFEKEKHASPVSPTWKRDEPAFKAIHKQLDAYFSGKLQRFEVSYKVRGTSFQQRVWKTLSDIPYGQTWSYAQLAVSIGKPKAARAVGTANAHNPISIIVPCHRVIGADGTLTGYGGGLKAKAWLLNLEKAIS